MGKKQLFALWSCWMLPCPMLVSASIIWNKIDIWYPILISVNFIHPVILPQFFWCFIQGDSGHFQIFKFFFAEFGSWRRFVWFYLIPDSGGWALPDFQTSFVPFQDFCCFWRWRTCIRLEKIITQITKWPWTHQLTSQRNATWTWHSSGPDPGGMFWWSGTSESFPFQQQLKSIYYYKGPLAAETIQKRMLFRSCKFWVVFTCHFNPLTSIFFFRSEPIVSPQFPTCRVDQRKVGRCLEKVLFCEANFWNQLSHFFTAEKHQPACKGLGFGGVFRWLRLKLGYEDSFRHRSSGPVLLHQFTQSTEDTGKSQKRHLGLRSWDGKPESWQRVLELSLSFSSDFSWVIFGSFFQFSCRMLDGMFNDIVEVICKHLQTELESWTRIHSIRKCLVMVLVKMEFCPKNLPKAFACLEGVCQRRMPWNFHWRRG